MNRTTTDLGANKWLVDDEPFRLRNWASADKHHLLPEDRSRELSIGRHPECDIRLDDERVSKHHALLFFRGEQWWLRDVGKKNGIIADGVPCAEVALEPGLLIELGGVMWIVESPRLADLRSYVSRLIGYGKDKLAEVDRAMRSVRRAAMGQDPLVLMGQGDLPEIARSLHRRVLGDARPFIVCNKSRSDGAPATVRSAENYETALLALPAARGGTLCVRSNRLPNDYDLIVAAHREPNARFQLVVCESGTPEPGQVTPIVVPPISARADELLTIVKGYADDARARLGVANALHPLDRDWIVKNSSESHPAIEKAAERVIATRDSGGNNAAAASRLGMSPSALGRWFKERKPLPDLEAADRRPRRPGKR